MKHIGKFMTFLMFVFGIASIQCSAQTTTQEEYDYVTKGYKLQVEGGLDMKQGYALKELGNWSMTFTDGSRGFHFIGLYRATDIKPCAIIAIYEKKDNQATRFAEYYCIPTPDANELWERTRAQLNENLTKENANEVLAGMAWALMKLSAEEAAK